jgi:hypothetical protein
MLFKFARERLGAVIPFRSEMLLAQTAEDSRGCVGVL